MLLLLSQILTERWGELSVLYVGPTRALLNSLPPRLERLAGFVGPRAGLWHGDIGSAARSRIVGEPPEFLLTKPSAGAARTGTCGATSPTGLVCSHDAEHGDRLADGLVAVA